MTDASPPPIKLRRRVAAPTLARRLGLHYVTRDKLTIERRGAGTGFAYYDGDGNHIENIATVVRLNALAVPPAYESVRYASDARAHLQAVGRDAAGRLQYRYHPEWEKVRETEKAQRLTELVLVLPKIRRSVAQHLTAKEPTKEFALASAIELVAASAIRPGSEEYAKKNGTRGAATLLKSNVRIEGDTITLSFRAKGGKDVRKAFTAPSLGKAIARLRTLPGRRLFQYRDEEGTVHAINAREVNAFLREVAGCHILLKDFRTLCASAAVLDLLARTVPAASQSARKKQVREAVEAAAVELANTPAVCRRSYVHETVVTAFEKGVLEGFASTLKSCRSPARRERFLAQVIATAAA
jgi:DNA topoisomerase-1